MSAKFNAFFATGNIAKQQEAAEFVGRFYGGTVALHMPTPEQLIATSEPYETFEANARHKAEVYGQALDGYDAVIADDSGLIIPGLNSEPGVKTRRHTEGMSNHEVVNYWLMRANSVGPNLPAYFVTTLAAQLRNGTMSEAGGENDGTIMRESVGGSETFPLRSIVWSNEAQLPFNVALQKRRSGQTRTRFETHREKALERLLAQLLA
jgi:non-canonical purine NTP pyrophosphatase (RdgB/HAM1 family)